MNAVRLLARLVMGRRLPRTQGTLAIAGPRAGIAIRRDRWSIPYIEAGNDFDAHFGVGFCQGQDRAFQLEVLQRVIRGTLSEVVGPAGLPIDRLSRRIGFYRASLEQFELLDSDLREMLEGYALGVNAGKSHGLAAIPHEFAFLRTRPTSWTTADSLGVVKLISWSLASNWDAELARYMILMEDGPDALRAVDPSTPKWQPDFPTYGPQLRETVHQLADDLAQFATVTGLGGASNNWALAGSRTATGRPILANDPHLDSRIPSHWHLVQVRTPDWAVAGAAFLGGPVVLSGHNGHAAWGMTAGLIDNTDLFWEEIGPDGRSIRQGERFEPCPVIDEVIRVRGGAAVTEQVLLTPRGPILSPALEGVGTHALSLCALWLQPRPLRGLLSLYRARSFSEFRQFAEDWPATSQHFVYADASGTIGRQIVGRAPIRRAGHGTLPLPGWDPTVGWTADLIPFDQMPSEVNPSTGFVATANTDPSYDGKGPILGIDWIDGYRLASLVEELSERTDWSVAGTQTLQMNVQSRSWREMREIVLATPADSADAAEALGRLREWDGVVAADSTAAAIFELFVSEMIDRTTRAKAPRTFEWALGRSSSPLTDHAFFCFRRVSHLIGLLRSQPEGWFPRPWGSEIAAALAAAVAYLRQSFGPDPRRWQWGRIRPLILRHPMGRKPLLAGIFNRGPFPCGGDSDTINQASAFPLTPLAPCNNIASLRTVIDVGAWENSRFSLPGGQSGNPLSLHYDDLLPLWLRGEGVPIAWSPEKIRETAVKTLHLEPLPTEVGVNQDGTASARPVRPAS